MGFCRLDPLRLVGWEATSADWRRRAVATLPSAALCASVLFAHSFFDESQRIPRSRASRAFPFRSRLSGGRDAVSKTDTLRALLSKRAFDRPRLKSGRLYRAVCVTRENGPFLLPGSFLVIGFLFSHPCGQAGAFSSRARYDVGPLVLGAVGGVTGRYSVTLRPGNGFALFCFGFFFSLPRASRLPMTLSS
jgi:hypothetical protein